MSQKFCNKCGENKSRIGDDKLCYPCWAEEARAGQAAYTMRDVHHGSTRSIYENDRVTAMWFTAQVMADQQSRERKYGKTIDANAIEVTNQLDAPRKES